MATRYMMATKAIHQLGDISSDEPDLCYVYSEEGDDYVGRWATGLGFFNVKFPKATTRDLTDEEYEKFSKQHIGMSGMDLGTAVPAKETL